MGIDGTSSRVLTTAYGAPITYASFGEAVAPGQLSMNELLELYRVPDLSQDSEIYALAGDQVQESSLLKTINHKFQSQKKNAICIPLETGDFDELQRLIKGYSFAGIQLLPPLKDQFKEQTFQKKSFLFLKNLIRLYYQKLYYESRQRLLLAYVNISSAELSLYPYSSIISSQT